MKTTTITQAQIDGMYQELDTLEFDSPEYCALEEKISEMESTFRGQEIENGSY